MRIPTWLYWPMKALLLAGFCLPLFSGECSGIALRAMQKSLLFPALQMDQER